MMTALLFLISVIACSAFAEPVNYFQDKYLRSNDIRDGNANIDFISRMENYVRNTRQNEDDILYQLYTRRNPTSSQRLLKNNLQSITSSNFDVRNPVVVIVHGWLDNMDSSFNVVVRDAFLGKRDVNLIMCDWSKIAVALYGSAIYGVPGVGRALGQFLDYLNKATGVSFDNMHLVGFSLGAHVVGNAGRELDGKVARITGLDPAGPLWYGNPYCLKPSDAKYVEAIHSDGGLIGLGIGSVVGDVDFFPNGGSSQPGCNDNFCNHNRAWELYASTITYNHLVGKECSSMLQVYMNNCQGNELPMGNDDVTKNRSGLYRVNTGPTYPY